MLEEATKLVDYFDPTYVNKTYRQIEGKYLSNLKMLLKIS